MRPTRSLIAALGVALTVTAGLSSAQPVAPAGGRAALTPGTWAITGATVITMRADSVLRDATVLVRDGRIAAVGRRAEVRVPRDARVVDGRGRYVIPGLADMHAHLYADEWVHDSLAPHELGVMLAHGITTVRLMIGTPSHLALRSSIRTGAMVGPQMWIASPQLSGDSAVNTWLVRTPDGARRAVRDARANGYDFIKLTTNITPDVYDAVVAAARVERLKVSGHVDPRVGVARALAAGQQIEHFDNYMESVLADSAPSRASVSDVGAYRKANWASLDHVDLRKVDAIAGATARAGVAVTPTLAFFRLWFATRMTDDEVRSRPDYAHIPAVMREGYERARARYWRDPPSDSLRAKYIAVRNRMVRALVDSGGTILAGSDGPGGLMGYGWGLHRELEMLVAAGLTPHEALASATRAPALWLGAERDWGAIAPGMRADLVLLDADPLADITHTSSIRGVSIGGRWIDDRERLQLLESARQRLAPPDDTVRAEVGSPAIDGRFIEPHAARVRIYRGDSLVQQWLNELTLGDSAGRRVMRWVTTSEVVPLFPNRPLSVLRQTYDARTLAPLGFSSTSSTGAFTHVSVDGLRVRGRRRTAADTTTIPVDLTIDRPGYYSGASDLVPIAAGLKPGTVMLAPLWSPNSTTAEYRVFVTHRDTAVTVEGRSMRAVKVEEYRRTDRTLVATWYLLLESPYMVYGEIPLPDGRVQRMTEVEVPLRSP